MLRENIPYIQNKKKAEHIPLDTCYVLADMSHDTLGLVIKRNNKYGTSNATENKKPKLLYIGDSFFGDLQLNTDSGLQALTNDYFHSNISFNIGGKWRTGFSSYHYLLGEHLIEEPQVIICEVVERNLIGGFGRLKKDIINDASENFGYQEYYYMDLIFGNNMERLSSSKLVSSKSEIPTLGSQRNGLYFFKNELSKVSDHDLDLVTKNLLYTQDYFRKKGIKIYFVIMPDKESLHPELFGPSQLPQIQQKLKGMKIDIIDMYSIFIKDPQRYYFKGDTHWNHEGVKTFTHVIGETVSADLKNSTNR
jgi:hypothetical protein